MTCDALELFAPARAGRSAEVIRLYAGVFLDGLSISLGEEIEDWVYVMRERIVDVVRRAHIDLAAEALAAEDVARAVQHAENAVDTGHVSPWEAPVLRQVLRILRQAGSPRAREVEADARELGIELEGAGGGALGRDATVSLPHVATSFVGRAAELAAIEAAFATPHARLLPLHGPAGAGKSRLAIEAAWRFVGDGQAADGAYFVPLETVGEASAVAAAVARVMGLTPSPNRTPEAQVLHAIAGRSVLVVLDTWSTSWAARRFVASILQTCARARLLVASRVLLNLDAEQVISDEGLGIDSPQPPGRLKTIPTRNTRWCWACCRPISL